MIHLLLNREQLKLICPIILKAIHTNREIDTAVVLYAEINICDNVKIISPRSLKLLKSLLLDELSLFSNSVLNTYRAKVVKDASAQKYIDKIENKMKEIKKILKILKEK